MNDYDFVISVIGHVEARHGLRIFITPRDFDLLYRWWEKRIPLPVIFAAIDECVPRRVRRGQAVQSYAAFDYSVRKRYRAFLELQVGASVDTAQPVADEITTFLARFPEELQSLAADFRAWYARQRAGENPDAQPLQEKLLDIFQEDEELNARTEIFLHNLAPNLRHPSLARSYRLNYLRHRFAIPLL